VARPLASLLFALLLAIAGAFAAPLPSSAADTYQQHYDRYEAALDQDDLETAVVHARRAYRAAAADLGPTDERTGVLAYNLGVINHQLGRHRDATVALSKAVTIYQAVYGESDVRLTKPLIELGAAHRDLAEWAQAERAYVRALNILGADEGDHEATIMLILSQLTGVADGLEQPARMRTYGLRGIAICSDEPGDDPLTLGKLHLSVARAEVLLGDPLQARRHTERGLELYEQAVPANDPSWANIYAFAADVYARAGKESSARKFRRKAEALGAAPD